jgi:hypothetical protein
VRATAREWGHGADSSSNGQWQQQRRRRQRSNRTNDNRLDGGQSEGTSPAVSCVASVASVASVAALAALARCIIKGRQPADSTPPCCQAVPGMRAARPAAPQRLVSLLAAACPAGFVVITMATAMPPSTCAGRGPTSGGSRCSRRKLGRQLGGVGSEQRGRGRGRWK